MLALAHTHVHWQPISPRDVLASKFEYALHAAGFFIQQSASKGLGSDSWIFVNSIGVHTGTHPICCLVRLFRQLGLQNLFQSFFIEALAYQMCTLGHTLYQFCRYWMLWNEMDDFFFTNE